MNRKKLEDAIKSNAVDRRALDMLDTLSCIRDLYSDVQMEVLRIKDEHDVPDGAFGNICKFAEEFRQYADDMFEGYYDSMKDGEGALCSPDVAMMVYDEIYRIHFGHYLADS